MYFVFQNDVATLSSCSLMYSLQKKELFVEALRVGIGTNRSVVQRRRVGVQALLIKFKNAMLNPDAHFR